ncbi:protein fem-1 homolog B-like [Porites lutea]|uniref:protein fem-1 homolog B-like n=1 Tax=Porites lutea TaxID=51062 RepID=UPI003CC5E5A9
MAHKLLSWFRRKITGDPGGDPKQKVFEAAQSGDAVLLDKVLQKLNCSERISVLSKQFINDDFSLPEREGLQVTPLIVAVENGNLDCVKVLLKYKADIEGRGDIKYKHFTNKFRHLSFSGCQPLFVAAVYGNIEILRCLLENGADINAVLHFDQNYYTPLMMAINYNHSDAVIFLIDQGADVNLQTKTGATALHHAVWTFETSLEIVSSLIKNGADVNARGGINKWTPLMMATERSYCRMVTFLIEHGAYIDLQDSNGHTALHYAMVKDEKSAGTSHLCDNWGLTPLLLASDNCNVLMVEHLIKQREIAKEQKIDALELLGASLALKPHKEFPFYDVKEGFKYIKRGMRERFADPSHPLLKQQMEPVEAYQNRKESQTLEELAEIKHNRDAIIMESLIIRERILGTNSPVLLPQMIDVAFYFVGRNLHHFLLLLKNVIKIALNCNLKMLPFLQSVIVDLPCIWSDDLVKDDIFVKTFDQIVIAYEHEIHRKMMEKEKDPKCKVDIFYLRDLVWMISKLNCSKVGKLSCVSPFLKTLCKLNPCDFSGRSLLHLFAVSHCTDHCNVSYTDATKLLLNAGFDVNSTDNYGNTALHKIACTPPGRYSNRIHIRITDMLQVLIDEGAHHDFVNNNGRTPMDKARTVEARIILTEQKRKLELQCIAAKAVKKLGIPYQGVVPKTLEKYISKH